MRYAVYKVDTGEILRIISCPEKDLDRSLAPEGESAVEVQHGVTDLTHYVQNDEPVARPPKPSSEHTWSWGSKSWVPDVASAKATKLNAVATELARRLEAPVQYEGRLIDADSTSHRSISDKAWEVSIRQASGRPDGMLAWLDANNQLVEFNTPAAYKEWLQGLLVTIGERNTSALAWSWQKKAEIEAAQTYEAVTAISLAE